MPGVARRAGLGARASDDPPRCALRSSFARQRAAARPPEGGPCSYQRPAARRAHATPGDAPRDNRAFTYADLRTSTLSIHHMPGHYIRRLQQVAVALFAQRLDGITPVQFAALAALRHGGTHDQATLAALIGYDRATIGGVIDRLLAKRWVARETSRTDRRMKLVSLTKTGSSVLRRVTREVARVQQDLMAPLSAGERRQFERLCLRLLAAHLG